MGSIEKRLDAVEMGLIENAIVEALVQMEIQEMLRVLEVSEAIEDTVCMRGWWPSLWEPDISREICRWGV